MSHNIEQLDILWQRFKEENCPVANEELVHIYLPFANQIVNRIKISLPTTISKDELLSYGIFGLFDAMIKFDPSRGYKFETYAYPRIKGAILDGLRSQDWMPTALRQKEKNLVTAIGELEQKIGRTATDSEIANHLEIDVKELNLLLEQLNTTTILSLDKILIADEDDGTKLIDTISDAPEQEPEFAINQMEVKKVLTDAINKLPEKEKLVVTLYYYEGLNLKEISKVMELSESRISQLHTKSIFRLRGRLSRQKKVLL